MNGGAWLTVDGHHVDIHYRDLDEVEHHMAEAEQGRFGVERLPFCLAGIPTYVVVGELALARAIVEEFHARLAARGEWALNEKRIVKRALLEHLSAKLMNLEPEQVKLQNIIQAVRNELNTSMDLADRTESKH